MPSISHPPREPVALTSDFTDWLVRHTDPDELGDAWECANRCAQRYDARRNASFRTYFLNRWHFRRIDLARQRLGRKGRTNRFLAATKAKTNMSDWTITRRQAPIDRSVEHQDTINAYKRRCKQRAQAMIVDCLASGLTYRETGTALGVVPSMVSHQVKAMRRFITTEPIASVRTT